MEQEPEQEAVPQQPDHWSDLIDNRAARRKREKINRQMDRLENRYKFRQR